MNHRAQSLIEYGLILGVVTVALLSMQIYFRRGIQSVVKVTADDFGPQGEAVGNIEVAIKKNIYGKAQDGGKGKLIVDTKGVVQAVTNKTGEGSGSIRTETTSSNTASGGVAGVSVVGDYKDRKVD